MTRPPNKAQIADPAGNIVSLIEDTSLARG